MNWKPIRKITAAALTALVSATGFIAWLEGTGSLDWRGWLVICASAAAAPVLGYLVPSTGTGTDGWWPIRKITAALIGGLTASTAFLAWAAGTGGLEWREVAAIALAAVLPGLVGYGTKGGAT